MLAATLIAVGGFPAAASHCDSRRLQAQLITDAAVPREYVPVPEFTGDFDSGDVRALGVTSVAPARFDQLACSYMRTWQDSSGNRIVAQVMEFASEDAVGGAAVGAADAAAAKGWTELDAPMGGSRLFVADLVNDRGESLNELAYVVMRRGRSLITLASFRPSGSAQEARELTLRQAAITPPDAGAPKIVSITDVAAKGAGGLTALVALYLAVVGGLARARDGVAGPLLMRRVPREALASAAAVDVSSRVRSRRRRAWARFALQIVGMSLIVGTLVRAVTDGVYFGLVAGLFIGVLLPWLLARQDDRRMRAKVDARRIFTGHRTGRVVALFACAQVLYVGAIAIAALIAVAAPTDRPIVVTSEPGEHFAISATGVSWAVFGLAAVLAAGGIACYRLARRFAAVDARLAIERDTRPVVLYLRSFTDDELKIRSAVTGRRSLPEQFSPRRFDRFEEVLVWQLSTIGPVVALNPPGTALGAIGAAKATLSEHDWRATIEEWMEGAAAIVVSAPPEQPTAGLQWELERIGSGDLWHKVIFVVPPVPEVELRRRWTLLEPMLDELGVRTSTLPDPAFVIAATVAPGSPWRVVLAGERSEWSYVEALAEVAAAQQSDRSPQRTGRTAARA